MASQPGEPLSYGLTLHLLQLPMAKATKFFWMPVPGERGNALGFSCSFSLQKAALIGLPWDTNWDQSAGHGCQRSSPKKRSCPVLGWCVFLERYLACNQHQIDSLGNLIAGWRALLEIFFMHLKHCCIIVWKPQQTKEFPPPTKHLGKTSPEKRNKSA